MRPRLPVVTALIVALLAVIAGLVLALRGESPRSDVLAGATRRSPVAPTPTRAITLTPTLTPKSTPTPLPEPTATPQPRIERPAPAVPPPLAPQDARVWIDEAFTARVLELVNAERTSRGLPTLVTNDALNQAAQSYAYLLQQFDRLSHSADGTVLLDRVRAAGYDGGPPLGEVLWLSVGVAPPERTVADWMASAPHRDAILNAAFQEAGASCSFRQAAHLEGRCVVDFAG